MVWKNGYTGLKLTPPHDILEKKITNYLPSGENTEILLDMMIKSYDILKDHPVNKARSQQRTSARQFHMALGRRQKTKYSKILRQIQTKRLCYFSR